MRGYNAGSAELGLGAGKGDADRSPGWRAGYDEIEFPVTITDDGKLVKQIDATFERRGGKLVKRYGNKS